jgi:putative transposase
VLEGAVSQRLKEIVSQICEDMEIMIIEGKVCKDHVHLCVSVPPKYSPAEVMKRIKGTTSEMMFREYPELRKRYWGQHFWARGYFVSTIGIDESTIRKYIKAQSEDGSFEKQLRFWK